MKNSMNHSSKMIWSCAAVVGALVIVGAVVAEATILLFAIPCMVMMGAMVWMMVRGMSGGSHN